MKNRPGLAHFFKKIAVQLTYLQSTETIKRLTKEKNYYRKNRVSSETGIK